MKTESLPTDILSSKIICPYAEDQEICFLTHKKDMECLVVCDEGIDNEITICTTESSEDNSSAEPELQNLSFESTNENEDPVPLQDVINLDKQNETVVFPQSPQTTEDCNLKVMTTTSPEILQTDLGPALNKPQDVVSKVQEPTRRSSRLVQWSPSSNSDKVPSGHLESSRISKDLINVCPISIPDALALVPVAQNIVPPVELTTEINETTMLLNEEIQSVVPVPTPDGCRFEESTSEILDSNLVIQSTTYKLEEANEVNAFASKSDGQFMSKNQAMSEEVIVVCLESSTTPEPKDTISTNLNIETSVSSNIDVPVASTIQIHIDSASATLAISSETASIHNNDPLNTPSSSAINAQLLSSLQISSSTHDVCSTNLNQNLCSSALKDVMELAEAGKLSSSCVNSSLLQSAIDDEVQSVLDSMVSRCCEAGVYTCNEFCNNNVNIEVSTSDSSLDGARTLSTNYATSMHLKNIDTMMTENLLITQVAEKDVVESCLNDKKTIKSIPTTDFQKSNNANAAQEHVFSATPVHYSPKRFDRSRLLKAKDRTSLRRSPRIEKIVSRLKSKSLELSKSLHSPKLIPTDNSIVTRNLNIYHTLQYSKTSNHTQDVIDLALRHPDELSSVLVTDKENIQHASEFSNIHKPFQHDSIFIPDVKMTNLKSKFHNQDETLIKSVTASIVEGILEEMEKMPVTRDRLVVSSTGQAETLTLTCPKPHFLTQVDSIACSSTSSHNADNSEGFLSEFLSLDTNECEQVKEVLSNMLEDIDQAEIEEVVDDILNRNEGIFADTLNSDDIVLGQAQNDLIPSISLVEEVNDDQCISINLLQVVEPDEKHCLSGNMSESSTENSLNLSVLSDDLSLGDVEDKDFLNDVSLSSSCCSLAEAVLDTRSSSGTLRPCSVILEKLDLSASMLAFLMKNSLPLQSIDCEIDSASVKDLKECLISENRNVHSISVDDSEYLEAEFDVRIPEEHPPNCSMNEVCLQTDVAKSVHFEPHIATDSDHNFGAVRVEECADHVSGDSLDSDCLQVVDKASSCESEDETQEYCNKDLTPEENTSSNSPKSGKDSGISPSSKSSCLTQQDDDESLQKLKEDEVENGSIEIKIDDENLGSPLSVSEGIFSDLLDDADYETVDEFFMSDEDTITERNQNSNDLTFSMNREEGNTVKLDDNMTCVISEEIPKPIDSSTQSPICSSSLTDVQDSTLIEDTPTSDIEHVSVPDTDASRNMTPKKCTVQLKRLDFSSEVFPVQLTNTELLSSSKSHHCNEMEEKTKSGPDCLSTNVSNQLFVPLSLKNISEKMINFITPSNKNCNSEDVHPSSYNRCQQEVSSTTDSKTFNCINSLSFLPLISEKAFQSPSKNEKIFGSDNSDKNTSQDISSASGVCAIADTNTNFSLNSNIDGLESESSKFSSIVLGEDNQLMKSTEGETMENTNVSSVFRIFNVTSNSSICALEYEDESELLNVSSEIVIAHQPSHFHLACAEEGTKDEIDFQTSSTITDGSLVTSGSSVIVNGKTDTLETNILGNSTENNVDSVSSDKLNDSVSSSTALLTPLYENISDTNESDVEQEVSHSPKSQNSSNSGQNNYSMSNMKPLISIILLPQELRNSPSIQNIFDSSNEGSQESPSNHKYSVLQQSNASSSPTVTANNAIATTAIAKPKSKELPFKKTQSDHITDSEYVSLKDENPLDIMDIVKPLARNKANYRFPSSEDEAVDLSIVSNRTEITKTVVPLQKCASKQVTASKSTNKGKKSSIKEKTPSIKPVTKHSTDSSTSKSILPSASDKKIKKKEEPNRNAKPTVEKRKKKGQTVDKDPNHSKKRKVTTVASSNTGNEKTESKRDRSVSALKKKEINLTMKPTSKRAAITPLSVPSPVLQRTETPPKKSSEIRRTENSGTPNLRKRKKKDDVPVVEKSSEKRKKSRILPGNNGIDRKVEVRIQNIDPVRHGQSTESFFKLTRSMKQKIESSRTQTDKVVVIAEHLSDGLKHSPSKKKKTAALQSKSHNSHSSKRKQNVSSMLNELSNERPIKEISKTNKNFVALATKPQSSETKLLQNSLPFSNSDSCEKNTLLTYLGSNILDSEHNFKASSSNNDYSLEQMVSEENGVCSFEPLTFDGVMNEYSTFNNSNCLSASPGASDCDVHNKLPGKNSTDSNDTVVDENLKRYDSRVKESSGDSKSNRHLCKDFILNTSGKSNNKLLPSGLHFNIFNSGKKPNNTFVYSTSHTDNFTEHPTLGLMHDELLNI